MDLLGVLSPLSLYLIPFFLQGLSFDRVVLTVCFIIIPDVLWLHSLHRGYEVGEEGVDILPVHCLHFLMALVFLRVSSLCWLRKE